MQVIYSLSEKIVLKSNRSVLTIGSYDGIHCGHKKIITGMRTAAMKYDVSSVLITFHPHPRTILTPHIPVEYLTTIEEKLNILQRLELDIVTVFPFSHEFSQTPAHEFIRKVVTVFKPIELWVGSDFGLGKGRKGNVDYLHSFGSTLGYKLQVIDLRKNDNQPVSSTNIRQALKLANIKKATKLLGEYPLLLGQVVEGAKRGRKLGFPTANIQIDKHKLLPPNGVYAVWLKVDDRTYQGVANIGTRPTFDTKEQTLEVYIFDFNQNIYGKKVCVYYVEYIRKEQKFHDTRALIAQIRHDVAQARDILEK